jgi:hypothetical protein
MKINTLSKDGWGTKKIWCGPAALALITGRSLKYCHNKLARIKGVEPRHLKGIYNWQLMKALDEMGYEVIDNLLDRGTLASYIDNRQNTAHMKSVILINVTNHYVVAHMAQIADNWRPEPVPAKDHPSARKYICRGWVIAKKRKARK